MSQVTPAGSFAFARARLHAVQTCAALATLALVPAVLALAGVGLAPLLLVELAAIAGMVLIGRVAQPLVARWATGARSERTVAVALEAVPDVHLLHDVATGHGNIDHVLVGRGGLYAVETKTLRGSVALCDVEQRWLAQAYAEAKHLERLTGRPVTPLLVLCGAYTEPWCRKLRGVWVLSDRSLGRFLGNAPHVLDRDAALELHERLANELPDR